MPKAVTGSLSAREMEILALAFQCFESNPKVNYTKLRDLGSFASLGSARGTYSIIRRKVESAANKGGAREETGSDKQASTSPTKRKASEQTKTGPAKSKKSKVKPCDTEDDEDEDEEKDVKPKRRAATKCKVKLEELESDWKDPILYEEA